MSDPIRKFYEAIAGGFCELNDAYSSPEAMGEAHAKWTGGRRGEAPHRRLFAEAQQYARTQADAGDLLEILRDAKDAQGRLLQVAFDVSQGEAAAGDFNDACVPVMEAANRLRDYVGSGQQRTAADSKTDSRKNSWEKIPENPRVVQLARLIAKDPDASRNQIDIALEFTHGDRKEAENLLRQVRRWRGRLAKADT